MASTSLLPYRLDTQNLSAAFGDQDAGAPKTTTATTPADTRQVARARNALLLLLPNVHTFPHLRGSATPTKHGGGNLGAAAEET